MLYMACQRCRTTPSHSYKNHRVLFPLVRKPKHAAACAILDIWKAEVATGTRKIKLLCYRYLCIDICIHIISLHIYIYRCLCVCVCLYMYMPVFPYIRKSLYEVTYSFYIIKE